MWVRRSSTISPPSISTVPEPQTELADTVVFTYEGRIGTETCSKLFWQIDTGLATHLGERFYDRFPSITDACREIGLDPAVDRIPVAPAAHYACGGIRAGLDGRTALRGLYAVGEVSATGVHGANRLGGNSLLDIVVFGRAAGNHIIEYLKENRQHRPLDMESVDRAMARLARWDQTGKGETVASLKAELQKTMEDFCGVFRNQEILDQGVEKVKQIRERVKNVYLQDHSKVFNTARIEALELENLVEVALATVVSAATRTESRGAHSRTDHPERDDVHWLKHSLCFTDELRMEFKPVRMKPLTVDSFPPKPRVY